MSPIALESLAAQQHLTENGTPLSAQSQTRSINSANQGLGQDSDKSNVIKFNVTKNELYKLDDGYKTLQRRQKGTNLGHKNPSILVIPDRNEARFFREFGIRQ